MTTPFQTQSLTPLTPPTTIAYQIVWQQTPPTTTQQQHPEQQPGDDKGNIVISVTDITTITGQESESQKQQRQYMAVAKLTWGPWEANFGCTYYPIPCMFLEFKCFRMNDAMRDEVQGMHVEGDGDEEREEGWENAEVKIRTAAADDHGNWMLRVEVGGGVGNNEGLSDSEQRLGVKLWAKRVVGDEEVKLSVAEKQRLQIE